VGKRDLIERAYAFFVRAEEEQRPINVTAIAQATGYQLSTTRIYITKKWSGFLFPLKDGRYEVRGVRERSYDEFQALQQEGVLVIHCSPQILAWLQQQAMRNGCEVHDIVLEVLKRQMLEEREGTGSDGLPVPDSGS
jgi:EAL domain-containing protein (putative c-di-GMP-specific phosphodiesterase class I)